MVRSNGLINRKLTDRLRVETRNRPISFRSRSPDAADTVDGGDHSHPRQTRYDYPFCCLESANNACALSAEKQAVRRLGSDVSSDTGGASVPELNTLVLQDTLGGANDICIVDRAGALRDHRQCRIKVVPGSVWAAGGQGF